MKKLVLNFPENNVTYDISKFLPLVLKSNMGIETKTDGDEDYDDSDLEEVDPKSGRSKLTKPGFTTFFNSIQARKIDDAEVSAGGRIVKMGNSDLSKIGREHLMRNPFQIGKSPVNGKVEVIKVSAKTRSNVLVINDGTKAHEIAIPDGVDILVEPDDVVKVGDAVYSGKAYGLGDMFVLIPISYVFRRTYAKDNRIQCSSIDGLYPKTVPEWANGDVNYACSTCPYKKGKCKFSCEVHFLGGDSFDTLYRISLKGVNYGRFFSGPIFKTLSSIKRPFLRTILVKIVKDQATYSEDSTSKTIDLHLWNGQEMIHTPKELWEICKEACMQTLQYYKDEKEAAKKFVSRKAANEVVAPVENTDDQYSDNFDCGEPPF